MKLNKITDEFLKIKKKNKHPNGNGQRIYTPAHKNQTANKWIIKH